MKQKVGKRVKSIHPELYFGMTGTVEYCGKCCRAYRIQWDGIGNSIKLKDMEGKITLKV